MQKIWIGMATCLILIVLFSVFNISGYFSLLKSNSLTVAAPESYPIEEPVQTVVQVKEPTRIFGIPSDSLLVIHNKVKPGQNLSQILQDYNISTAQLDELRQKSKDIFNLQQIQAHKPYTLLCNNDSTQTAQYFIYQPSPTQYVVFDLQDSLKVYKEEKEIQKVERKIAGSIKSSLYEAMAEVGCSPGLINHFADIYSWKVNFAAIQPGDKFKLIFEEHLLEGESIGYGKLKAAYFEHKGEPMYAIYFEERQNEGYYDAEGKSMKKAFLKEPLEYTRISSRYSKKRFHPVQKRYKAHLGTDFAAPHGTPIRSVGQGLVIEAGFSRGNGKYVKIQHDKIYTTQYLHMSKFAKGIRKGTQVKMGQTIGYVGSTGLASGPHLCYRFWKNGKQVDALKEKLPVAHPIDKRNAPEFEQLSQQMMAELSKLEVEGQELTAQESKIHAAL